MKKKLLALLFGSALVLAACGGGGDEGGGADQGGGEDQGGATDTASVDAETTYKQKCSSCHGGNLEGGVGPELAAIGSKYSAEEIQSVIANGQGQMPPNIIEGAEAEAVAEWLANKK